MINVYTANTPNGQKVVIALEEMALNYNIKLLTLSALEQKEPSFLAINPNGRIPAIIDTSEGNFSVFESGAILVYLAEKTNVLLSTDIKKRSLTLQWLTFQLSGLGPIMGQAGWFLRSAPKQIETAINRYQNETKRLLNVIDKRLCDSEYLAGDEYSIADISMWTWARRADYAGIDAMQFPCIQRWVDQIANRPQVVKAMTIMGN